MDYYTLQVVRRGGFEMTTEFGMATVTPGAGCVLSPEEHLRIRFALSTAQIAAKVPAAVVERGVGQLSGGEHCCGLVFAPRCRRTVSPSHEVSRPWAAVTLPG